MEKRGTGFTYEHPDSRASKTEAAAADCRSRVGDRSSRDGDREKEEERRRRRRENDR